MLTENAGSVLRTERKASMSLVHVTEALRRLPPGTVFPSVESARLSHALERLVGKGAARSILGAAGTTAALRMKAPELASVANVPLRLAERVVAARETGEFLARPAAPGVRASTDVAHYLPSGFAALETEVLLGLALTTRMTVKDVVLFAKGGDAGTSVGIRDIFVPLVRLSAAAVVLVHNHPSSDPTPSREDVDLTNRVARAGRLLGIEVIDHLIVALVGETVRLIRRGRSFTGLCPFHKEKTPSFHVNPERGLFHCFGCKESGTAVDFAMKSLGMTFPEAVRAHDADSVVVAASAASPSFMRSDERA